MLRVAHLVVLVTSLLALGCAQASVEVVQDGNPRREASAEMFDGWLDGVRVGDGAARGLYHAYLDTEAGRPWFISTAVSADVLRYRLSRGQLEQARETGDALLRWQHDGSGEHGERLGGAFPSEIVRDGASFAPAKSYDSSDTLAVVEALLDLHAATADTRYREAAKRAGAWLRDVMAHGERFAMWQAELGGFMRAATSDGAFDNRVAVGRMIFWLPTLRRLAVVSDDPSFSQLASDALAFARLGQTAAGGFYDHYDPGYPAVPFDVSRFRAAGIDGSVYADDSIRAAAGARALGDGEAAERFLDWLGDDNGRVHGYLSLDTGEALFVAGDTPYYDVISSSLYARLAADLDPSAAAVATSWARSLQSDNGGWYWGYSATGGAPISSDQATLTGLWALADLSPR